MSNWISKVVNRHKELTVLIYILCYKDEDGVLTYPELNVVMKSLGQRPSGAYRAYTMKWRSH